MAAGSPQSSARCVLRLLLGCVGTMVRAELLVGVGKADVTGIIAQSTMVGFADPEQIAAGLHTRLWARAFVALDDADPLRTRVAFVSADIGMPAQAVQLHQRGHLRQDEPNLRRDNGESMGKLRRPRKPEGDCPGRAAAAARHEQGCGRPRSRLLLDSERDLRSEGGPAHRGVLPLPEDEDEPVSLHDIAAIWVAFFSR